MPPRRLDQLRTGCPADHVRPPTVEPEACAGIPADREHTASTRGCAGVGAPRASTGQLMRRRAARAIDSALGMTSASSGARVGPRPQPRNRRREALLHDQAAARLPHGIEHDQATARFAMSPLVRFDSNDPGQWLTVDWTARRPLIGSRFDPRESVGSVGAWTR
jgi:hypothetical protein